MNKEEGKIFIVTSGSYSDYTIVRVFSTRAKANEYLDTKDDDYKLEVYDIDEPIERTKQVYQICFSLDKKKVYKVDIREGKYADLIHVHQWNGMGKMDMISIFVESDSRKRALKVASERYGVIISAEQIIFPYLRVPVINRYCTREPAYFDFYSGKLVLLKGQQLAVEMPDFIKVQGNEKSKTGTLLDRIEAMQKQALELQRQRMEKEVGEATD